MVNNKHQFKVNMDVHNYETRNKTNLHQPLANLAKYYKGPYYFGIKVFSCLPADIKELSDDIKCFKNALKRFLTNPIEIKAKQNKLIPYAKTEPDYELLLREIQQAKIAYHTYQLPHQKQPRVTLKGLPPNIPTEEITAELQNLKLQVNNIRQIVRKDKDSDNILVK
jgi:hypothetical protein